MRTLYITIFISALMAVVIPLHGILAVSPDSPTYTHFLYMFGHANLLHWSVNAWCLCMVHRQFNMHRVLSAWLCSVLLSFIYYPRLPVLGASVIVSFFMGFNSPWLFRHKRVTFWQMIILLAFGLLMPNIAGLYHAILFGSGLIYVTAEKFINKINHLNP